jgi:hypothetical protein
MRREESKDDGAEGGDEELREDEVDIVATEDS